MKTADLIGKIEDTAILCGAATWDNCGVQIPNRRKNVQKIALALDPTEETIQAAIAQGADFILTHHPLLMKPRYLNRLDTHFSIVSALIQNDICLYSAHTSLDANPEGPAGWLARALELQDCKILGASCTFEPEAIAFTPSRKTAASSMPYEWENHPHIHCVRHVEQMINVTYNKEHRSTVLAQLAADLDELPIFIPSTPDTAPRSLGFGTIGTLPKTVSFGIFAEQLASVVDRDYWVKSGPTPESVTKIAYCTGSGSDFAPKAFAMGADVFITGDVKYHSALDTTGCILDVGHFSLEEEMMRQFALQLATELEDIEIFFLPAQDPMRLIGPFAE
ncbi:Nif3-like dinuclear metal center hexameric protein [Halodesulfovibrio aestuarii]|uniref:Nif3-like dinuclear metal center hexameric protein n=1 Tax=Halodesulfovibrio aestuarii TaxID=126333 RepID=UPI0004080D49